MGIWQTNKASFKVNIVQSFIEKLKGQGCKFCWIKDNGIVNLLNNEKAETGAETGAETAEGNKILEVITSEGDTVKGYIMHIVDGYCSGTDIIGWFIICPEEIIVVQDL